MTKIKIRMGLTGLVLSVSSVMLGTTAAHAAPDNTDSPQATASEGSQQATASNGHSMKTPDSGLFLRRNH